MRVTRIIAALLLLAGTARAQQASYGPYQEETYIASGDPKSTTAVAIMHGGWDVGGGDNTVEVKRISNALAQRHVYVVSFNYRLARPGAGQGWPAQWQDAQLMMRFLRSKGYSRVGIVGLSAGAYNALGVAFKGSTIYWGATDPKREAVLYPGRSGPDFAASLSPARRRRPAPWLKPGRNRARFALKTATLAVNSAYWGAQTDPVAPTTQSPIS